MKYVMTSTEFIQKIKEVTEYKTLYIKGCFGAPMNASNKKRYTENTSYNKNRAWIIEAATSDTFGFDCVNMIKGVLWGWVGDKSKTYGGAKYCSNDVPDINADTMITVCNNTSSNFDTIVPGEVVWMAGHIGVYVGNGKVVECTPKWDNCVQYSNLANIGCKDGRSRTWTKHGKLPWIDYAKASGNATVTTTTSTTSSSTSTSTSTDEYYTVVKGDTLSKIAKKYNTKYTVLAKLNGIKFPYIIKVGQVLKTK